ncbi:MAG: TIGR02147 family protein [Desulfococcaceae bacterium]|jgi:uncharacterized protein (TIGR02147 family)|nr:TIGR02147 family protein [Desulfococcaceae bacterium]
MKYPNVFEYLDYRAYLRDMFQYRKAQIRHFSYRYFSRKSGFRSPNFLKLVMDGLRNLSSESVGKVARGFDLKKQERDYFEFLVFMNQAASHEDKNHYYRKMMSLKGYKDIRKMEAAEYEYFSNWYYPVIREILMFGNRRHSPEQISGMLRPAVTVPEVKKALAVLEKIGLIRKNSQGQWEQNDRNLSTGAEVKSLVIANYHREMLRLAGESLERWPAKERDISALVLSVRKEHMEEIKKKTARFRKELLEMASEEEEPDQVLQVNIQVFPLAEKKQGGK